MSGREHRYAAEVEWTGNRGTGTSAYRDYGRDHLVRTAGRPAIAGSSDPVFLGDADRWNPEEMLVGSLCACHMLWYLSLCAVAGVAVTAYRDEGEGWMTEEAGGAGQFTRVVLRPRVRLAAGADRDKALALHHEAHEKCFIARSMNFPVDVEPRIESE